MKSDLSIIKSILNGGNPVIPENNFAPSGDCIGDSVLDNTPKGLDIFLAQGGHYTSPAQALEELADNAISAIKAGGGTGEVLLRLVDGGNDVDISVYDSGTGITDLGTALADKDNAMYYKGNMASSGLEIRMNGRCITRGLYAKVFGKALHPSCNRFLAQIELCGENAKAFPPTETTKNAFVESDEQTQALFRWIRTNVKQPDRSRESLESRLVGMLAEKKQAEGDTLRIAREEGTYRTIGLRGKIDLLVSKTGGMTIYEAKAKNTKAEDLYQLRLYTDGCAMDGIPAQESVLIGAHHPQEVCNLLRQLNTQKDPTGRPYHFVLRTWEEEGISA